MRCCRTAPGSRRPERRRLSPAGRPTGRGGSPSSTVKGQLDLPGGRSRFRRGDTTSCSGFGKPVAVALGDVRAVRVWDLATGEQVGEPLTGNAYPVLAVATGVVDGRPVAVAGGEDRAVRVWDLATGQQVGAELVFPDAV